MSFNCPKCGAERMYAANHWLCGSRLDLIDPIEGDGFVQSDRCCIRVLTAQLAASVAERNRIKSAIIRVAADMVRDTPSDGDQKVLAERHRVLAKFAIKLKTVADGVRAGMYAP